MLMIAMLKHNERLIITLMLLEGSLLTQKPNQNRLPKAFEYYLCYIAHIQKVKPTKNNPKRATYEKGKVLPLKITRI